MQRYIYLLMFTVRSHVFRGTSFQIVDTTCARCIYLMLMLPFRHLIGWGTYSWNKWDMKKTTTFYSHFILMAELTNNLISASCHSRSPLKPPCGLLHYTSWNLITISQNEEVRILSPCYNFEAHMIKCLSGSLRLFGLNRTTNLLPWRAMQILSNRCPL